MIHARTDFAELNDLSLTPEWIASRLAALGGVTPGPRGDEGHLAPEEDRLTPAGVLVPLVNRETGLTVLFTQRTSHLADHAGQISFPGGRAEEGDVSIEETALRETEEEIGLPRSQVWLLGRLPVYITITGYRVTPVVGWIEPPFELAPDPFEVAEVFEVPARFLLDAANHQQHIVVREGRRRHYWAMPYQGRYIWGATAGMLKTFYHALRGLGP